MRSSCIWSLVAVLALAAWWQPPAFGQQPDVRLGYDTVFLRRGAEPLEGTVVSQEADGIRFLLRGQSTPIVIAPDDVEKILWAKTATQVYAEKRAGVAPNDQAAHLELGAFCVRYNMRKEAEDEGAAAIAAAPQDVTGYRFLATTLRAWAEATEDKVARNALRERELAVYEAAKSAGAHAPDLFLAHARMLQTLGARYAAKALLSELQTTTGDSLGDPSLRIDIGLENGWLALALAKPDEAIASFEAVKALDPSPEQLERALHGLALATAQVGDFGTSAIALGDALALNGPRAAELQLMAALALILDADYVQARALVSAMVESSERMLYDALLRVLEGKSQEAAAALAPFAGASALRADERLVIGFVLCAAGHSDAGLEHLKAAATEPTLAGLAWLLTADVYSARSEFSRAEEALLRAGRTRFDFGAVALRMARTKSALAAHDAAVRFARYAVSMRPDDPEAQCELGRALAATDRFTEAEQVYTAIVERWALESRALSGLGHVLYAQKRFAKAEATFQRLLELSPDDSYALRALARMRKAREWQLWSDSFDRSDSKEVRNRWLEDERFGVEAAVSSGLLVFSGTQLHEEMAATTVRREAAKEGFAAFRLKLRAGLDHEGEFGLRVERGRSSFDLWVDGDSQLLYAHTTRGRQSKEPVVLGRWPDDGGFHELALEIERPAKGSTMIVLFVDEVEVGRTKAAGLADRGDFTCAAFVRAAIGAQVDLSCDLARVYIWRR